MAIQEPASPLWTAVKAIYDPWPADDEAVAAEMAGAWRSGGSVLAQGAQEATRAGEASLAAWPDAAGEQFHGRVGAFAAGMGRLQQNVANRAAHAEYYGNELTSAKNAIVSTIAQNEKGFAAAGLAGPAMQSAFAGQVAADLQQMIAAKADALRTYPADSPPVSPFAASGVPPEGRLLTAEEAAIAESVFGNSLNTEKIRIFDGGGFAQDGDANNPIDGIAVATPGAINFPRGVLATQENDPVYRRSYQGWLVHELTHQWQYQHGASIIDTGLLTNFSDYKYDDLQKAKNENTPFLRFDYEEQGQILRHFYERNRNSPITDPGNPYLHYANQVRGVAPGEKVIYGIPPDGIPAG